MSARPQAKAARSVARALAVLAGAAGCVLAGAFATAAAQVPMQGSEVKPLPGCAALRNPAFVTAQQALIDEFGWEHWPGDVAPRFECFWSHQDEARCEAMGWRRPRGSETHSSCYENTQILHGHGGRFQTRAEAEQALLGPARVAIRDPRLEQPEYGNVLITKNPDNSPVQWEFLMTVVTPDQWWMPIDSSVQVVRTFTVPAASPRAIEAAERASAPVPGDAAVVTAFLDMLEPAQCILPTPECITRDLERAQQGQQGLDDRLRELRQQAQESQRAMEEALRRLEAQQSPEPLDAED